MDKRTMAKDYATEVLKKYKLISPTLDNLVYIVGDYGFEIIDFGRESNPGGVASLIAELSVQKYVEASNAFTFQQRDIKLIFVYEALPSLCWVLKITSFSVTRRANTPLLFMQWATMPK